jgi:ABC-type transport system substrate-binding protein
MIILMMIIFSTSRVGGNLPVKEPFSDKERNYDPTAGHADELYFQAIIDTEQQILALQNGKIDMIGNYDLKLDPVVIEQLQVDKNIEINHTIKQETGLFLFNCRAVPTELRQAFAHALDKKKFQIKAWAGYSSAVDSLLGQSQGNWSLDNQDWWTKNYQDPDPIKGNELLDDLGWNDTDNDGWRENPKGRQYVFTIRVSSLIEGSIDSDIIVSAAIEAFESIDIKAKKFNSISLGREPSVYFYAWDLAPGPISLESLMTDPLGYYPSSNWNNPPNNFHWSNATYDQLVETMLSSSDRSTVEQACWDAQVILWHEQPVVPVYQEFLFSAYRKDPWTGWVNTRGKGVYNHWTLRKAHVKQDYGSGMGDQYEKWQQGGRLNIPIPIPMNTKSLDTIYDLVYDCLFKTNPYTLEKCTGGVAKDWLIEELNDSDPNFSNNYPLAWTGDKQRIIYWLHEGIKFHDGRSLTAEDVAFSYEFIKESNWLDPITHVEVVNSTTIEIYCNTASLFNMVLWANWPVRPKHVWKDVSTPLTWENSQQIGSGPYKWKSRTPTGDIVILERNDDYFYNPRNYRYYTLTPEEQPTTDTTWKPFFTTPFSGWITILVAICTLVVLNRKRKKDESSQV